MLFTEKQIESLKDDPVNGIITLCDVALSTINVNPHEDWTPKDYQILLEVYALVVEVMESGLLPIRASYPSISGTGDSNDCEHLCRWIRSIRTMCVSEESKLRISTFRNRFRTTLAIGFVYEFSQGDLERIQMLVNQLREQISTTEHFEKEHQQRLLKRLERLQAEMHKKVSDLDRFWGLIGDAGVVLGKLGDDAKPIVDRIREIADIVWQTQSRAEELPSGTKLPQLESKTS